MIEWYALKKFLPLGISLLLSGLLIWSVYAFFQSVEQKGYDRGWDAREALAVKAKASFENKQNALVRKRMLEVKQLEEKNRSHLKEVLNVYKEKNANLKSINTELANQRVRVRLEKPARKPSACPDSGLPGGGGIGNPTDNAQFGVLSKEASRGLDEIGWEMDAQTNQLEALITLIRAQEGQCLKIVP